MHDTETDRQTANNLTESSETLHLSDGGRNLDSVKDCQIFLEAKQQSAY